MKELGAGGSFGAGVQVQGERVQAWTQAARLGGQKKSLKDMHLGINPSAVHLINFEFVITVLKA